MTHDSFVKLVDAMRVQQRSFFKSDPNSAERRAALHESKRLEKEVDAYITKYKQGDLQLPLIE